MDSFLTVLGYLLSACGVVAAAWLGFKASRDATKNSREGRIEARMDKLEKKLDRVQAFLREEQKFSHRLVLSVQSIIYYVTQATAYRSRHELPGSPPPLPDVAELQELIRARPTYNLEEDED